MIVIQLRLDMKQDGKKVNGHSELDLLKREDATELEWKIAQRMQAVFLGMVGEIIKPVCKEFKMEIIK